MIYSPRVCKAMNIAMYVHGPQFDKGDYPYFAHPLHLAEQCTTESETIVALLHDVLENQDFVAGDIKFCCTDDELTAIQALTRPDGISYQDYIKSVAQNELAREIKILDLSHNLDRSRYDIPDSLVDRYEKALNFLLEVKDNE